jgi:excisionase family DNA binding protein
MERDLPTLHPEVFEAVVDALAQALVLDYRVRHGAPSAGQSALPPSSTSTAPPTWLTGHDAANRVRCGEKTIYREVAAGWLRAVRVGGRKSLRFRAAWIDEWLEAGSSAR